MREVRTDRVYKKGELVLVPMTSLTNIAIKDPSTEKSDKWTGKVDVRVEGAELTLSGPPKPKSSNGAASPADAMLVPYWWVASAHKEEDATMHMTTKAGRDGTKVPCLINSKALPKHTKLTVHKQLHSIGAPAKGAKRKAKDQDA